MLQRAVEAMGIEVMLNAETAEIGGTDRVEGVVLKDGRTIEADAVVVGDRHPAERRPRARGRHRDEARHRGR